MRSVFLSAAQTAARTFAVAAACVLIMTVATTAHAEEAAQPVTTAVTAPSVDTVTVVGTPRSSTTPAAGPQVEAPGWRASDPGMPEADTTTYSAVTASNSPAPAQPSSRTVAGSGGRSDGSRIPWWVLLLVAGGIAVAAH